MKMWEGRFKKQLDEKVNDFNSSISFDFRMYEEDITGSIAHASMLGRQNIIPQADSETIIEALKIILSDIKEGKLNFDPSAEDIHMFVEAELTKRIGEVGKKLHTARSRNDQVALDFRMYIKKECDAVIILLAELLDVTVFKAEENIGVIMPGFTHLQHGQPILFSHHILAYAQMIRRDILRMNAAKMSADVMPLGSCALAGTTYPIDRFYTAQKLGFGDVCANSIDGVSDRDFAIEFANALAIIMMHLSRFSEEIILWCTSEFGFIELDDAFATGSSIMPQKKNPDIAELVRGKSARIFSSVQSLLTMMKGLPLAYNKDMQEDKAIVFEAVDNTKLCISTFSGMVKTMRVMPDSMKKAAQTGFLNATDCADYLVRKGMPFRDAYKVTGALVALCIEKNTSLELLPVEDFKSLCPLFDGDIYKYIDLGYCVNERKSYGGPSEESVRAQIDAMKEFLTQDEI